MKKTLFIATAIIGLLFSACNPMNDINNELDAKFAKDDVKAQFLLDKVVAPDAYTLTDADYELSSNESVSKYHDFSASALPKDYLPEILNKKFSGENAQSMMVTYNYYSKPVVDYNNAREITSDEYGEMGQNYSNFGDQTEAETLIGKLLDRKVYAAEAGTEMTVKYTLFKTYQTRYIKVNADGTNEVLSYASGAVTVTDAIYEATGNGKYKNFYKIGNAQDDLTQYAIDNNLAPITYAALVYLNYLDTYVVFYYDGVNWQVKQSIMPVTEELNYALNETDITQSTWWADPAIKITLGGDDYALFPGGGDVGGTAKYGNFDLRSGLTPGAIGYNQDGSPNDALKKLIEMIGQMLDTNHNAVENQQYLVTYAYYNGSNGTDTIRLIKEGGVWKEYTEASN